MQSPERDRRTPSTPPRRHRSPFCWWAGALTVLALQMGAAATSPARAAGLLVADGGFGGVLEIVDHEVSVTVNNGVAVTTVNQIFRNTERRQVEALYTFPVPRGASVSNFSMWINGVEMVGEVLEKERARQIYESYKQTRRDPGLLEQVDYRTFEMRVFPIGPQAEQRIQITYYQELDADHDWATYVYPLATATRSGADARTSGRFALTLDAKSPVPIVALESPSHGAEVVAARHSEHFWQASLERVAGTNLDRDVVVAYRLARPRTGIDLLAHREGPADGTFCLTLTAGEDAAALDEGMDYVFLLDVSGSMGDGGKLLLSKDSVGAFLRELGEKDRFELLAFNVQPATLFNRLEAAGPASLARAEAFLAGQQARGGTVLNPALTTAYKYRDADRTLNVVVLSDGLTEQRERTALAELIRTRPGNTRVFCIGVGNDVNRPLLEQLARDSGGLAAFLSPGDDFARQARAFRRKLQHPVATGLALAFEGVEVTDLEPPVLPSLYHGAPVRVYGRYPKGGSPRVTLTGEIRGVRLERSATLELPGEERDNPELERMWAWHRIDRLLREADRGGSRQAVVDEVVRLGEAHSIATEYTSFIVLEDDAEYRRWKIERKNALLVERDRKAQERLRAGLDAIRERAVAGLGPEAAKQAAPSQPAPAVAAAPPTAAPAPSPEARRRSGFDIGIGSGPVGPLFVGLAAWLARRRKKERG
ncbi:MAG: VIT and VWA domain-containing protein [Thermodesulfobacteriota bacterium]